jgi:hypothetical protein
MLTLPVCKRRLKAEKLDDIEVRLRHHRNYWDALRNITVSRNSQQP